MQLRLTLLSLLVFSVLNLGQVQAQCSLDCPAEMDVFLPENGNINLGIFDLLDSIPADCPPADSISLVPNQLNCSFAGSATPYELRHVRTGGLLCSGVLNVKDTTTQELICRENITVFLPEDRDFRNMIQADYVFAISDNCDRTGLFNFSPRVVDCSMVGEEVNYAITATGSEDTLCTGTVTVVDTTNTPITCKEQINIELSPSGFPSFLFPGEVIEGNFRDNCHRSTDLNLSPVFYNCEMEGDTTYYLTNRTTGDTICTGTVTVIDPISPQVSCVDTFELFLAEDGSAQRLSPGDLVTLFSDNCGTVDNLQIFPVDSFDCTALDAAVPYDLVTAGSEEIVCSGLIEVIDTFNQAVQCEENVIVSLPLTYDGFSLSPDIFVKEDGFSCNGASSLEAFPKAVYCYNAGEEMEYILTQKTSGDTVCVGSLKVEDSNTTAISCVDSIKVTLPRSGRPYRLDWRDVVSSFSDNCISVLDLEVSPQFVECADAGQTVNYSVSTRNNSDVLCQGIVEVIDETPLQIDCKETIEVRISPSGFPGILFPSGVISQINDNCTSSRDFRTSPTFFFCPDSSATYTLIDRRTNEVTCTGRVIVTGSPSPFGNCVSSNQAEGENAGGLLFQLAPQERPTLRLFPNPTQSDKIQVQLPDHISGPVQYRITNLLGAQQKIGRFDYQGGTFPLSLNGLSAGTYVFVIRTADGQRITKRFVKTR